MQKTITTVQKTKTPVQKTTTPVWKTKNPVWKTTGYATSRVESLERTVERNVENQSACKHNWKNKDTVQKTQMVIKSDFLIRQGLTTVRLNFAGNLG